jgi:hypothetical protein
MYSSEWWDCSVVHLKILLGVWRAGGSLCHLGPNTSFACLTRPFTHDFHDYNLFLIVASSAPSHTDAKRTIALAYALSSAFSLNVATKD